MDLTKRGGRNSQSFILRRRSRACIEPTWNMIFGNLKMGNFLAEKIDAVVDGETQEIWPKTAAWFLGPKAENFQLLKDLIDTALEEHVDFRQFKYFPLDPEYVTNKITEHKSYIRAVEDIKHQLRNLSDRLKNSVPFFSFRSQGHMLWDTTIASNVGYIAALLYNQNNVASMASGVTLQLEREVSRDLCKMVGYNVDRDHTTSNPKAWGHLPNGGSVANIEAVWAARCLKFHALAIKTLMETEFESMGLAEVRDSFSYTNLDKNEVILSKASAWELLNIPIDEAIDLFDKLLIECRKYKKTIDFDELFGYVKRQTMEEIGAFDFIENVREFLLKSNVKPTIGKWFVSGSRHYSWDKSANILGLGRSNLELVSVDKFCRMNTEELKTKLEDCLKNKIPVLGVTVVFGTTQEGAVDDLKSVLKIRQQMEAKGMTFYIHVDAAWGGYFASCLNDRSFNKVNNVKKRVYDKRHDSVVFLETKLSPHFVNQLSCLNEANSLTLDPHKSGFCPYPAGGLLYRNGNIRHFLAQGAAYISHGSGKNEEINLFGIDGSKPGAASAGVWLSHKVIGLHSEGYGLLLRQCTFSAGIMYALWSSIGRDKDPFIVVPSIPASEGFKKWTPARIRREILNAESKQLQENHEALTFLRDNGPDSLINCLSINSRNWNSETEQWENNTDIAVQKLFIKKFYARCSHSIERPTMVDRGIEVILNSTIWKKSSHSGAYDCMKERLGLDPNDPQDIGMIINTSMSPWLRAQRTYKRLGIIIRNELYNAHGAVYDEPHFLNFVSPSLVGIDRNGGPSEWNGYAFVELEASFSNPSLQYHVIAQIVFPKKDQKSIKDLAKKAFQKEYEAWSSQAFYMPIPLRMVTRKKMRVFDLLTTSCDESHSKSKDEEEPLRRTRHQSIRDKIKEYSDSELGYDQINMPEIEVSVYFVDKEEKLGTVDTVMKVKRVLRYHHLARCAVDDNDYPPNQEYFLYSCGKEAYMSHIPNRFPDFQQQIHLDYIPGEDENMKSSELYMESLRRGIVIYLPSVETGGKPITSKNTTKRAVCKDPLKSHFYNAIYWSDQGAFTGRMTQMPVSFFQLGRRWFSGKRLNQNYKKSGFPHLFDPCNLEEDKEERDDGDDTDLDEDKVVDGY